MRSLDYPIIIDRIMRTGLDMGKISVQTGIHRKTVEGVRIESHPWPPAWDVGASLIDMHCRYCFSKFIPDNGDFGVIVDGLVGSDLSLDKISRYIGLDADKLSCHVESKKWPERWCEVARLISLYLSRVNINLPVYGEHNQ